MWRLNYSTYSWLEMLLGSTACIIKQTLAVPRLTVFLSVVSALPVVWGFWTCDDFKRTVTKCVCVPTNNYLALFHCFTLFLLLARSFHSLILCYIASSLLNHSQDAARWAHKRHQKTIKTDWCNKECIFTGKVGKNELKRE